MKSKRTLMVITLVAIVAIVALGVFRGTRRVQAQTGDQPPPQAERLSFGMVGITRGQTIRLSVANVIASNDSGWPPGPTRVVLTFLDGDGQIFRNCDGSPVRQAVLLERGQATILDLSADDLQWPPGPTRLQLRAVVNAQPPPIGDSSDRQPRAGDGIAATVEVFNDSTMRTSFVLAGEARMGRPDSTNHNETLVRDTSEK
ncbi:MAG: hypothetical protein LC754_11560 [Acidobacteria bacterium]|nr:hypothetical protein [Acidobacteriota bacterium]